MTQIHCDNRRLTRCKIKKFRPPICSLDWTLYCRMGWGGSKNLRVSLNGYVSNPVVCQPVSKQVFGIKME